MRAFFAAVLALAFFAAPVLANDKVCVLGDEAEFRADVARLKPKMFRASEKAVAAILNAINLNRAKSGTYPMEADKILIGVIPPDGSNETMVGIAMFKDGCVVPGSVHLLPVAAWAEFLTLAGLSPADFIVETSA